jgi:hypothetical protein
MRAQGGEDRSARAPTWTQLFLSRTPTPTLALSRACIKLLMDIRMPQGAPFLVCVAPPRQRVCDLLITQS